LGEKVDFGVVNTRNEDPDEALPGSDAPTEQRVRAEDGRVRDLGRLLKGMEADNSEAMVPLAREKIYDR
jgi:hypothetical protein